MSAFVWRLRSRDMVQSASKLIIRFPICFFGYLFLYIFMLEIILFFVIFRGNDSIEIFRHNF